MLKPKLNHNEILRGAGFGISSGYYAGRSAALSDINGVRLERAYRGVLAGFGVDAAQRFLEFVEYSSDLSASAFMVDFEKFIRSEFQYLRDPDKKFDSSSTVENEAQGFAMITGALFNSSETDAIKQDFREFHRGNTVEPSEINLDNWSKIGKNSS